MLLHATRQSSKASRSLCFAALLLAACGKQADDTAKGPEYTQALPGAQIRVYRMDILPQYNPAKLVREYQPFVDYLNRQIGADYKIELSFLPDYQVFEHNIRTRAADFVLGNPWHVTQAIDAGYHVIAMAGDADDFRGIFIVRKDSPIRQPRDLIRRTVSYPSPTALAAGMMPQWFLQTHGVDVTKDTKSLYVGSQASSIMSVYLRQSDAGATWPPPWRQFQVDYPKEAAQMRVVWSTNPLVNNGVVARNDVPAEVCAQVQAILLGMSDSAQGRALLEGIETARFHPARDRDYDTVRRFVASFEKNVRRVESP